LSFWAGTLLFDFVAYLIPFSVFLGVSLSYDIWVVREHLGTLMIIMASFGMSFLPFTYACGLMYKKASKAFNTFPIVNFFVFFTFPMLLNELTNDYPKV
jgi:hypothetical protein